MTALPSTWVKRFFDPANGTPESEEQAVLDRIERSVEEQLGHSLDGAPRIGSRRSKPGRFKRPVRALVIAAIGTTLVAGIAIAAGPRMLDELDIFNKPASTSPSKEADRASSVLGEAVDGAPSGGEGVPADPDPIDPPQFDRRRVLLKTESDGMSIELVGMPTASEDVCYTLTLRRASWASPGGGGGCVHGFKEDWPVGTMLQSAVDGEPIAYGITPDGVKSIELYSTDFSSKATFGANAYFWKGRAGEKPEGIRVEYLDGTTKEFPLAPAVVASGEDG